MVLPSRILSMQQLTDGGENIRSSKRFDVRCLSSEADTIPLQHIGSPQRTQMMKSFLRKGEDNEAAVH